MPDIALLQLEGAPPQKQFKRVPLTTNTWFSGLVTQRSPFSSLDNRYNRKYLGGRPDQLIDGLNTELSNYATIIRRPGSTIYTPGLYVTDTSVTGFYSFHQLNGAISVMMDCPSNVYSVTPTAYTSVFAKSMGAGQTNFLGVGNTLYMGNGVDLTAWAPAIQSGTRNWGIVAPSPSGASSAYCGTGSGASWTNPTHIQGSPDSSYATYSLPVPAHTNSFIYGQPISCTNYGFAVTSGATIVGVTVNVVGHSNTGSSSTGYSLRAQLVYNGSPVGNYIDGSVAGGGDTTTVFGGSSNTWGATLTTGYVNNSTFGVILYAKGLNTSGSPVTQTYSLDACQIVVTISGAPTATPTGSGSLSTTNGGWQYVYAYGNTASGHISNPTLPSTSTGNFTSKSYVGLPVVASTDTQVNTIHVYRTKDGGSVYYELPTSPYPNTSTTIQDSNPDASLQNSIVWPQIPWLGNSTPEAGLTKMAYHMGRVWGAVGNYVYYSAGPDATIGNGAEAFPPANYFLFPSQVSRLIPYSSGLLVFTIDDIYVIYGTSLATFYAMPFQQGVGVLSYNALDVQGTTIFALTSDGQGLSISSSGINEIGFPIGNLLETNLNPSLAYVASLISGTKEKAVFYSDGSTGWYRCNWNQSPEGGPAWSPQAVLGTGGIACQALTAVEVSPGVHYLMFGVTAAGRTYACYRDWNNCADLGTPFEAYCTFGSFILANPGNAAEVDSIVLELQNRGSVPTVGILTDEIGGTFEILTNYENDPPELTPSTTVMSNRWYLAQGGNAARMRHLQLKVDFGNVDITRNELLTTSLFGGVIHQS